MIPLSIISKCRLAHLVFILGVLNAFGLFLVVPNAGLLQAAESAKKSGGEKKQSIIGSLPADYLRDGAACFFYLIEDKNKMSSERRIVFMDDVSDQKVGWMNINGKAISLKLAGDSGTQPWHGGKDKATWTFENGDIKAYFRITATKESGGGDFTAMDAALTVTKGSETQSMEVTGGCGG